MERRESRAPVTGGKYVGELLSLVVILAVRLRLDSTLEA